MSRWNRVFQAFIRCSESKFGWVLKFILIIVMAYITYHNISSWVNRHRAYHLWCVPNVTVSLDGKGQFTAISLAVEAAPANSSFQYCIYISRGVYRENVFVGMEKTNLVFVGDGIGKTIITSSRSSVDEFFPGDQIATLRVIGERFMAIDITIENTASPEKERAMALENGADKSVFYRCSFSGHRETLYTKMGSQFYRECQVYGTQNFIFGDALVVFQKCYVKAIKLFPIANAVISRQFRENPLSRTGFVFHLCKFTTVGGIEMSPADTYLGIPSGAYSLTVVMQSYLDNSINPVGWLVDNLTAITVICGEYDNHGPGADTKARMNLPGVRIIESASEASFFTVGDFLKGNSWLPYSGEIPYDLNLVK